MLLFRVLNSILGHKHDLADGMRATRLGIGHCCFSCAALVTDCKHVHDLVRLIHYMLCHSCNAYTFDWIVSKIQVRILDIG